MGYIQRTRLLGALVTIGAAGILLRLFTMQVVQYEQFSARAETQLSAWNPVHARRGEIVDARGRVLVSDEAGFELVVRAAAVDAQLWVCGNCGWHRYHKDESEVTRCPRCLKPASVFVRRDRRDLAALARRLDLPLAELEARVRKRVVEAHKGVARALEKLPEHRRKRRARELWYDHGWRPRRVASDVSYEVAREVELHRERNPAFRIRTVHTRRIRGGAAFVHIIGSVKEDKERMTAPDGSQAFVEVARGGTGLENRFEPELHGVTGWMRLHYDRRTRERTVLDNQPPVHGFDLRLTIDRDDQESAVASLDGATGAFVVVNADTGAVIALVSTPNYEPGDYALELASLKKFHERHKRWPRIHQLLEGAAGGWYTPGSVLKPFTAVSALTCGVSTPDTTIDCRNVFRNRSGREILKGFRCNGTHGELQLEAAITRSCNIYFQTLMGRMYEQKKLEHHDAVSRRFGFGLPTGVEVEPVVYRDTFVFLDEKARWGDIILSSIGQARITLSPAQIARAYAGLATGSLPRLHLVAQVGARRVQTERTPLGLPDHVLAPIRRALRAVPRSGTARQFDLAKYGVHCKTGTAERSTRDGIEHNAWLAGFVPARAGRPPIAFAMVVLDTREHGADACGPRLADFMSRYYAEAPE